MPFSDIGLVSLAMGNDERYSNRGNGLTHLVSNRAVMTAGIFDGLQDWPTWVIVAAFLGLMVAANELGFRVGRRHHRSETELSRTVSNAFKGSIFGLVAHLLGFSFSVTTSRYDLRQRIVLDQSNAIGTCYQRAGLLDGRSREQLQSILSSPSSCSSSSTLIASDAA